MTETKKSVWEQLHSEGYKSFSEKIVYNTILKNYLKYLKKDDHVLDIGCGTGDVFEWMWPHIGAYSGVDISKIVCDKMSNRYIHNSVFLEARPCLGDGTLPFNDNLFDVVFSCLVLQHIHIEFVEKYIQEAHRTLVKDGLIMFHTTEWPDSKSDDYFRHNKDSKLEINYTTGGCYNHNEDSMQKVLISNGFKLIDFGRAKNEDLIRANATWLMFVARKI